MNTTTSTTDDLDILDFAAMDAPAFATKVGTTLVLAPTECFPGQAEAWATADAIERRNIFLMVGNCHLAEVQLQRLHPEGRQHALDHLPDPLPVEDPVAYTRTLNAAIKVAPPPPPPSKKDKEPPPPPRKLDPAELEPFDSTTPSGRLLVHLVSAMAEFERAVMIERTKAGLSAAIRRGARPGRPRAQVDLDLARRLRGDGKTFKEVAEQLGIGVATLHRAMKAAS